MEEDSKLKPEDVVAKFEKEQEAQSIISYKELVNAVKNRQEEEYEDELEGKPLSTVSTIMEVMNNQDEEEEEVVEEVKPKEEIKLKEKVKVEEKIPEITDDKRFKKTDVISPVFGIVKDKDTEEISNDEKINKEENLDNDSLTALDEIYKQMADDLFSPDDKTSDTTSLDTLTKNEEFLQSLKDFRKNL